MFIYLKDGRVARIAHWLEPKSDAEIAAVEPGGRGCAQSSRCLERALRIAQRHGFTHMVPVAAPTPLATRYNAWLREYFATLSSWVLNEG